MNDSKKQIDPRHQPREGHPLSSRLALASGLSISIGLILLVDAGSLETSSMVALGLGLVFALVWAWLERAFLREMTRERHMPYGLNNAVYLIIVAAICLSLNLLAHRYTQRIPGLQRWDVTRNAFFSFSPQTLQVLKTLDKPIQVVAFYPNPKAKNQTASLHRAQRASVERLLKLYAEYCPLFKWQLVDPEKDPMAAKRYGVKRGGTVIVSYGDRKTALQVYDFFTYPHRGALIPKFKGEQALTSALLKLSEDRRPKVYFLEGHGEATIEDRSANGLAAIGERVAAENYRIGQLNLIQAAEVPEDCACLIVTGPRIPLDPRELKALDAYMKRGGCALFMVDTQPLPGIARILKRYEILWKRNVVIDPKDCYFRRHSMPLPKFNRHAITDPLVDAGLRPVFDEATAFGQIAAGGKKYNLRTIAQSSAYSWAETKLEESNVAYEPEFDEQGPLILATACSTDPDIDSHPKRTDASEYRLVVIGDSHFARNRLQGIQGNADFVLNCVNWLTGEADRLTIRPKVYSIGRATLSETWGRWIFYGCVFCLPGLILFLGLAVYWKRRSL